MDRVFRAFDISFRTTHVSHIQRDATREVLYEGKITRLVYNHGAHPTRKNDRSPCIRGFRRFPEESRSNSPSAAINKLLKSVVGSDRVVHRLRHNFKDLLRESVAPS